MKTLKLLLFLVSALVVTAFNSIASTPANDAGVINIADSRDFTISIRKTLGAKLF